MSAPTELLLRGSSDTVFASGSTSSLANSALVAAGTPYTPTSAGYPFADWILTFTFGTAPTASTAIQVWLLREDGANNYEEGSASVVPSRYPDLVFPVLSSTSAQRVIRQCALPPGPCMPLVYNNGTGQTISSGWSLLCVPYTRKAPTQ